MDSARRRPPAPSSRRRSRPRMSSPPRRVSSRLAALLIAAAIGAPALLSADDVAALIADGDAHFARRSEGAHGGTADPREATLALQSYWRAQTAAPDDLEVLARLMWALHFRAEFCGADLEARKRMFDEARQLGQAAVDRLEAQVKGRSAQARLDALRARPGAGTVYYWTAVCWGQWGLARGKFASARAGVDSRVRDLAETVAALDPMLEEGGGSRILGRLHDKAPRIPLITGWVSHAKAIEYLRTSYE